MAPKLLIDPTWAPRPRTWLIVVPFCWLRTTTSPLRAGGCRAIAVCGVALARAGRDGVLVAGALPQERVGQANTGSPRPGDLGREEFVWGGRRVPGSGMLANKPRDTSRLTRWKRWQPYDRQIDEAKVIALAVGQRASFRCECGQRHDWSEMAWVPNVMEYQEEYEITASGPGLSPVLTGAGETTHSPDPGGGRWVLICACGMGHYMLSETGVGSTWSPQKKTTEPQ